MKKIMFNDKYGLTQAVLEGRKTMTRRIIDQRTEGWLRMQYSERYDDWHRRSPYMYTETLAIAQAYKDIYEKGGFDMHDTFTFVEESAGWTNKMFVKAKLMPHHIKITNIRVERLQDISDDDCLREGIYFDREGGSELGYPISIPFYYTFRGAVNNNSKQLYWTFPRHAFATLIDKVSGNGTWESNPLVWVYEFELVD